jgi:hypothetical protein
VLLDILYLTRPIEAEAEVIPSTITPTIPESTINNTSSDKSVLCESFETVDLDDDTETTLPILTNSTNTIQTQEFSTFNDSVKYQSPNTQRKRQRDGLTKPKIDHPNKKTNVSTQQQQFTNFKNDVKKSSIKSDYFSIISEDDDDDFKQIKITQQQKNKTNNKNNSCFVLTDDEEPTVVEKPKVMSFQPTITSTIAKATQKKSPQVSTTQFNCINCNNFICDLSVNNSRKTSLSSLNMGSSIVDEFTNKLECKNVQAIINHVDIASFKSNTTIRKSGTSDQFISNSFIDEDETNCWQFIECGLCFQVIAFILKFTNCSDFKSFLNKILIVCP